jgi:hypothetical protein
MRDDLILDYCRGGARVKEERVCPICHLAIRDVCRAGLDLLAASCVIILGAIMPIDGRSFLIEWVWFAVTAIWRG